MFCEVMGSLWLQARGFGLVFGPGGPEGPEGPFQPLGLDVSALCQDLGCEYCFVKLWVVFGGRYWTQG